MDRIDTPEGPDRPAVEAAYQQARDTYERARRLIYDRYPAGLPPLEQLTEMQRSVLADAAAAETELRRLRMRRRAESETKREQ